MRAVAKPSPGAFLDMFHHHAPVWQAFALWWLNEGRGLQPTQKAGGRPAEGSAGEVPHATVRGGVATITQCAGLVLLGVRMLSCSKDVAGLHRTLIQYLIRGMCMCCIMCVDTSSMRRGPSISISLQISPYAKHQV